MKLFGFILLFALVGCAPSSKDVADDMADAFRSRVTVADTTKTELDRLEGQWSGRCSNRPKLETLIMGGRCGNSSLDWSSDYQLKAFFPKDFFDAAIVEEVANCLPSAEFCNCSETNGEQKCHQFRLVSGACQLTLTGTLHSTRLETTRSILGEYNERQMRLSRTNVKLEYLDAAVEATEAPSEIEFPDTLSALARAKYSCQSFARVLEAALSASHIRYNFWFENTSFSLELSDHERLSVQRTRNRSR